MDGGLLSRVYVGAVRALISSHMVESSENNVNIHGFATSYRVSLLRPWFFVFQPDFLDRVE